MDNTPRGRIWGLPVGPRTTTTKPQSPPPPPPAIGGRVTIFHVGFGHKLGQETSFAQKTKQHVSEWLQPPHFVFCFQFPRSSRKGSIFPTVSEETGKEKLGKRGGARHSYFANLPARRAAPGQQVNKHLSRQENYLAARGDRQRDKAREGPAAGPTGRELKAYFCPNPIPVLTDQPLGERGPGRGALSPGGHS